MIDQNIKITRGDDVELSDYSLKVKGDYTGNTIKFTLKENRVTTSDRYVDLTVTTDYDDNYTRFTGTIPKANTQGLTFTSMDWDLVSEFPEGAPPPR